MSVGQNYVRDRVQKLVALVVIAVVVQLFYASYVAGATRCR
jgi:hypothetical protein